MNRRAFLKGAAASLFAAGGCRMLDGGAPKVSGIGIGVQMWSIDDVWKKDPVSAFRRLRSIGYTGVQSFGFYAMNWDELDRMLDGEGLQVVDMPFYMKTLEEDEGRFAAFCERFGVDFVFEPEPFYREVVTQSKWRGHAEDLVGIARRFAVKGIRVGYHNHQHELHACSDGGRPIDILYEAGLPFELDVGHVKLAGDDPVAWLGKLSGRAPSIHAKPAGGLSVGGKDDRNDWHSVLGSAIRAGTKWLIVECEQRRDTYEDVEESMRFLKEMGT